MTHSLDVCSAILVSGFNLLIHIRVTYNLDACLAILVSGSVMLNLNSNLHPSFFVFLKNYLISETHYHHLESYQFALQKIVIRFHKFSP